MPEPTIATTAFPAVGRADVATPNAARYGAQLCKHFHHKLPDTEWSETTGRIVFPTGECRLSAATDTLTITVAAGDAEALATLEDVVARHLVRFAFREDLEVAWRREPAAAPA